MATDFSLSDAQTHFARTIALGPSACPHGLFAGDPERVLRGLKVHANTISHARLVALEETFPQTREMLGPAAFHALSHGYLDAGHGRDRSLDQLGEAFVQWLADNQASSLVRELALFEWLWLESYHAAEATPLGTAEIAWMDAEELGSLRLRPHPAARVTPCSDALAAQLGVPGPGKWALIARPDVQVLVRRLEDPCMAMLAAVEETRTFFQAVETFLARQTDNDPLAAMQFLLGAGVLVKGD